MELKLLFSDYFNISNDVVESYGALDICVNSDLPLFIDPFLLFASEKDEYQKLHTKIVDHLISLKNIAIKEKDKANPQIFQFPEIKQNWLGFCEYGNNGKGLGKKFAKNIISEFNGFYADFGNETISSTSHIEKLALVGKGIGRDFISDFTTNLIFEYLLEYTETFAKNHLNPEQTKKFSIRCKFNNEFKIWTPREFILPYFFLEDGDFILLTPVDILTKDEAFICYKDLNSSFRQITNALENSSLRDSINKYFYERIPHNAKKRDVDDAISATIKKFPEILDYYIRKKEDEKDKAQYLSDEKVKQLKNELIFPLTKLCQEILNTNQFFNIKPNSYAESLKRANYLKDFIENNDGYRIFYVDGKPRAKEETIQKLFKLTWFHSPYDVNSEVNNGRGPADYKVSFGSKDSAIVEFKLARSSSLKANLQNQTEIYKKASMSTTDIKVILCYTVSEICKVQRIVKEIISSDVVPENIVIIDASPKESASKVRYTEKFESSN